MDHWTTNSRTFRTFLLLMEIEPEKIRARMRQARKEAKLSQSQLADLLGVHKRTIENYERVRVPWDHMNEYARLTNRPVEWFLYGDQAGLNDDARLERVERELAEIRGVLARQARAATEELSAGQDDRQRAREQ